jgi:uncharacterized membrane protein (UPF0127 family)
MSRFRSVFVVLTVAALAAGCNKPAPAAPPAIAPAPPAPLLPTKAQGKLTTTNLWIGAQVMVAELALTPSQIQTGMMFRTNMAENEGMLFIFGTPQPRSFWMKNCPYALSAAYIDPDGTIQEIHPLEPFNTNSVESHSSNIQFVLETSQGWFERHNVSTGAVIRTEFGPLKNTFSRQATLQ